MRLCPSHPMPRHARHATWFGIYILRGRVLDPPLLAAVLLVVLLSMVSPVMAALDISKSGDLSAVNFDELGVDPTGLVGYWQLNGNAHDSSGQHNDGTIYGATATTDRFGVANGAMSFNGVDNYLDLGNSAAVNFGAGDFTFCLWLGPRAYYPGETWSWIVSKGNGQPGFMVTTLSEYLRVSIGNWFTDVVTDPGRWKLSLTLWHHIVIIRSGGMIYVYVNAMPYGTPVTSNYDFTAVANKALILGVMNPSASTWEWLNGKLDEVKIFSRALSASEVLAMYNHEKGKFSVGKDGTMKAVQFVEDPALPVQMRSKKESLTVKGHVIQN